jgi:hypothetical protein
VAVLALAAVAWLVEVAIMTEAGFSGNARYLLAPIALACLAGGAALGALLGRRPADDRFRMSRRSRVRRSSGRPSSGGEGHAGGTFESPGGGRAGEGRGPNRRGFGIDHLALALAVLALAPSVLARADDLADDASAARNEARLMDDLDAAVSVAGGPGAVRGCGGAFTGPFQVPALAWRLDTHLEYVQLEPVAPGTVFRSAPMPRGIPGAPRVEVTDPAFRPVGRTSSWQVLSSC